MFCFIQVFWDQFETKFQYFAGENPPEIYQSFTVGAAKIRVGGGGFCEESSERIDWARRSIHDVFYTEAIRALSLSAKLGSLVAFGRTGS